MSSNMTEHLSILLTTLADFIFCVNIGTNGTTQHEWISKQPFIQQTGYDEPQLDNLLDIIDENDREYVEAHLHDQSKDSNMIDCRMYSAQGHLRWLRLKRHPVIGADADQVTRIYYIGQDITETFSKYIYQRDLLGHVPHELAQPISTILTRLYMLRKQPDRIDYHLDIVDEIVNRLKYLLHDLQLLSRVERGIIADDNVTFSLAMLMQQVLSSQKSSAEKKHITLNASLSPTPIQLHASHERIKHALSGILGYILHFSPVESTVHIRCYQEGEHLIIDIYAPKDCIDDTMIDTLFTPFARIRNNSTDFTGLELSLAQSILEMHNGTIDVQTGVSDQNHGDHNLFRVTILLISP